MNNQSNLNIVGQERSWKSDTNHERFKIVKFKEVFNEKEWFVLEYFTTDSRKQVQDKQTILEKSVLLESELTGN